MRSRQSPFADLPRAARPTVATMAGLAALRAVSLIVIANGLAITIVSAIADDDRWHGAVWLVAAGLLLRGASVWLSRGVAERLAGRIRADLRQRALARVLTHGGRDGGWRTGELTTLLTRELDEADGWFTRYLPALIGAFVLPVGLWLWIAVADWVSGLVIVLTMPLIPVFMALIGYRTRETVNAAATALERLSHQLAELARGLPVLVGLSRASDQATQLREVADGVRHKTLQTLRIAFLSSLALELIASISVAIVAVFIGLRLVHGSFDLQTGLMILILAPEAYLPFRQVGAAFHAAESGREAMRRVEAIAATPSPPLQPGRLGRVSDLVVRYVDRNVTVGPVSFVVTPGSITYLAGASGSGKSSILHALAGTIDPAIVGGTIGLADRDVAFASQHPVVAAETIRDEIVACGGDLTTLERVGAAHLADRHPSELSPGEVRRVAVGRVLARVEQGATVALLDEPTAHLDHAHASDVIEAIRSMARHAAVVVSGHDGRLAAVADVIVRLDGSSTGPATLDADVASDDVPVREVLQVDGPVWPLLRSLIVEQRRAFGLALGFGVLAAIAAVALASVSGWLIVRASEQPPILYLLTAIVGVRLCGIGRAVARYAERLWMHDGVFAAMGDLRVRVWQGLAARGPASGRHLDGPETLDRLIGDIDRLRDAIPRVLLPPIVALITWIVATMALALVVPAAGLVLIAAGVAIGSGIPRIVRVLERNAARDETIGRSMTMRMVGRVLLAAPDLRGNRMEPWALDNVATLDTRTSRLQERRAWVGGMADAAVVVICGLTSLAMVPVALAGNVTGPFVAVLVLTPLALIDIAAAALDAVRDWPALRQVAGRLSAITGDAVEDVGDIGEITEIEVDGLTVTWPGRATPVFSGLSFTARRGQWVVVTGPSGAGKSTLLALLLGFLTPSAGTVRFDGIDIAGTSVRKAVAWCPQEAHVFDSTVRANLLLALARGDAPSECEMWAALTAVFPPDRLASITLDTPVGSRGSALSGGQRQRLALARTLLTRSNVVLLDEPTAHLDAASAEMLLTRLRVAFADRIVIMVTHRVTDQQIADIRVCL